MLFIHVVSRYYLFFFARFFCIRGIVDGSKFCIFSVEMVVFVKLTEIVSGAKRRVKHRNLLLEFVAFFLD